MLALLMLGVINLCLSGLVLWQIMLLITEIKSLTSVLAPYRNLDEVCSEGGDGKGSDHHD